MVPRKMNPKKPGQKRPVIKMGTPEAKKYQMEFVKRRIQPEKAFTQKEIEKGLQEIGYSRESVPGLAKRIQEKLKESGPKSMTVIRANESADIKNIEGVHFSIFGKKGVVPVQKGPGKSEEMFISQPMKERSFIFGREGYVRKKIPKGEVKGRRTREGSLFTSRAQFVVLPGAREGEYVVINVGKNPIKVRKTVMGEKGKRKEVVEELK